MEDTMMTEADWLQSSRVGPAFAQLQLILVDCCRRLNAQHKCSDPELVAEPRPKQPTERFHLLPKNAQHQDSLNAVVTLSGDNVVQAEISLKYLKSATGFYRATAQPDVHWKMQQLQDAANWTVRALDTLRQSQLKYLGLQQKGVPESELRDLLLFAFQSVKSDLKLARSALTMPKKKSLVEICNFHPIKSFMPPLPHDILLSFYLSSAKLVCAAYQVAAQKEGVQTVTIYQAECQLPRLVELVQLMNSAFAIAHDFWASLHQLVGPSIRRRMNALD